MKRKLLAMLLTLSMALSLLPLSALAAWQIGGKDVTDKGTTEIDGTTYHIVADQDNNQYYTFDALPATGTVQDKITYYSFNDLTTPAGTITWVDDVVETVTVSVTFAANGGSGTMEDVNLTAEQAGAYNAPACDFTAPTGYEFAGWLVDDATEAVAAGTALDLTGKTVVTLTAQWKAAEGTVVADAEATVTGDKVTATVQKVEGTSETTTTVIINATAQSDDSSAKVAEITLNASVVTTLKSAAALQTVVVNAGSVATVELPKEAINKITGTSGSTLKVDASQSAGTANSTKIAVELGNATLKNLITPIKVEVNISVSLTSPIVAFMKQGAPKPIRMWGSRVENGKVSFRTRHLSDFAVMEAKDTVPATIDVTPVNGAVASVDFHIEPGATVQVAYDLAKNGETIVGTSAGITGGADDTGLAHVQTSQRALSGGTATVKGIYAVDGELEFDNQTGWTFNRYELIESFDAVEESE